MSNENVSSLSRTSAISVTHEGARMLLELLTQAAAKGPDARTLATLYDEVKEFVDRLPPKK